MKAAALSLLTIMTIATIAPNQARGEIAWQTNLRTAHAQAQAEGKLLLLHFYSDNCSWCDKLEAGAFQAGNVNAAISQNFVPVKVHANSTPKLAEMFKVTKFPTDVIVTTEGKTLSHGVSPQEPARYIAMLTSALPTQAPAATADPNRAMLAATKSPAPAAAPQPTTAQVADAPGYAKMSAPPSANYGQPTATTTLASTAGSGTTATMPSGNGFTLPPAAEAAIANTKLASSQGAKTQSPTTQSQGLSLSMPEQLTTQSPTIENLETARQQAKKTTEASVNAIASSVASGTSTVAKSVQPVSTPELAMDGYCAVTVVDEAQWVEGNPEFGVIHLGKLYLFASEAKMKKFLFAPIPYTPVLNEIDVVRFFEERVIVQGKREWSMQDQVNKRMFFFADEAAMIHFENHFDIYVDAAIKVMDEAVQESNPRE